VLAALAAAMVSGSSMVVIRKLNGTLSGRVRERLERGDRTAVMRLQISGLIADVVRAGLLTFVLLVIFHPMVAGASEVWGADPTLSNAVVVGIAAAIAGGIIWNAIPAGSRRARAALIAVGVIAAVVIT
jgi:ACR3 family arsenite efflux pump ArsB